MPPFHQTRDAAPMLNVLGDVYRFLATSDTTGGLCTVMDCTIFPGGGPPPHTHSREDEHFTILDGEITFLANGREFVARAGDYVFAPRNHAHAFGNRSSKPARMLIHIVPGGLERMFMEFGTPASSDGAPPPLPSPADLQRVTQICPRYGITLHLPT